MANKEVKIPVVVDDKKAKQSIDDLIKKVDKVDGETATMVLAVKAADVQSKLADVLQQITKLDANDPVIDVKLAEASSLKGDLDSIEAKVKSLNSTPVDIDTTPARRGIDDIGKSADSSKSVMANMVGNATQDLGQLGGVAGSAGVAIGQMGEYMADALGAGEKLGSVIGSFAKVAGPLAAVAVVTQVATSAWEHYKKTQAEAKKATDDAAKSIEEELGLVDKLKNLNLGKATTAAEEFNKSLIANEDDRGKAIRALGDLNLVSDQLGQTMINLERNSRATLTTLAEGAGIPKEWAGAVAEAIDKTESFTQARAVLAARFDQQGADIANTYKKELTALEALNDQQQKSDTTVAAQKALDYAKGIDTGTAALVAQAEATAKAKDANADAVDTLDEFIKAQDEVALAAKRAQDAHDELKRAVEVDVDRMKAKWDELRGNLSIDQQVLSLRDDFDAVKKASEEAFTAAQAGAADAEAKQRDYESSILSAKQSVIDLGEQLGLSLDKTTTLVMEVDKGQLDLVEQQIEILRRNNKINLEIIAHSGAGYNKTGLPQFAEGGTVPGPVGQPVLAVVHGGEEVIPATRGGSSKQPVRMGSTNHKGPPQQPAWYSGPTASPSSPSAARSGVTPTGGGTYTVNNYITINVPPGVDPGRYIIEQIAKFERANGAGWRAS